MPSARTQHRSATSSPRGRAHRQAQSGRRFTRGTPPSTRGGLLRRRRQPEPGRAEKLLGLIGRALPGGGRETQAAPEPHAATTPSVATDDLASRTAD
jgi:hypothetical protein